MRALIGMCVLATGVFSCQSEGANTVVDDGSKPEENRFTTTILTDPGSLDEPMAFTFLSDDELMVVERKGGVKTFNVAEREMQTVGQIPVNTIYTNKEGQSRPAEEGLMGVAADPDFVDNHWVYMLYAHPEEPKHVLSRYEFNGDSLLLGTEKVVLEYHAQREVCCHTGGGITFDKEGNLYLTTGNNTANPPIGTSNLDERPGHETSDDQRTAGNTNDLRGKILRIHPEDDGSYTIPEGNLFAEGTEGARPEIYTMGHRNPWRVSVDSKTGYIYWGEVGPDASEDSRYGPRGYDEFNQAKSAGFHGWPYFIGDNKPYTDYDYATDSVTGTFDVNHVVNNSPNNTGLAELPTPVPAFIWYPYRYSEEFPLMGSSGRSATGGPIFRQEDFPESDFRFPSYYEGKWLMVEFMRGWIMAVEMDENGDYVGMEPFLPGENFSSAIDMQFSPDGRLYVLEYGSAWFRGNENAQIKRIEYNGGNRPPVVVASADQTAGALPLTVQLSSEGTVDYDKDELEYRWTVSSDNGFSETYDEANPTVTLDQEGTYTATLAVTDAAGNSDQQSFELLAGNAPPEVDIVIEEGNRSFFFPGSRLKYDIRVADPEDGSLADGQISADAVAVNFDYAPEGYDPIEIAQNHVSSDEWVIYARGKELINESDCLSCHREDVSSVGPSYQAVAEKYAGDPSMKPVIVKRIIEGSVGLWGDHAMSAHPDLSERDAGMMVDYILSLDGPSPDQQSVPLAGTYVTEVPERQNGKGGYLLRAAYTDRGTGDLKPLTAEKIIALRNPVLDVENSDKTEGTQLLTTPGRSFNVVEDGGYVAYRKLDLTGISEIEIKAEASGRSGAAGGVIEVRSGGPDGELLGSTEQISVQDIDFGAELGKLKAEWEAGGKKGPEPGWGTVREKFQPRYTIPIDGVEGLHDLYFVVRNPEVKPGQILVQLQSIEFKNTNRLSR
ncbi:PQQ-dependent sugar dehydrogenase [Neolewinella litorea]|uniref:Carbohydrate-binding protein n=1 Tax=Neolewinella litorea TaxID=2562452 RepID=A0A4V6S250_9BACT|nr:PQQ-dependent sugar dehydrogenase [Neolewinella litorea]THH39653.1 carbohydrate-binding protein [Neolewinella litorea]